MSLLSELKEISDLAKQVATVDLQMKILDLRGEIMEIQEENLQLRDDNKSLNQELAELRRALSVSKELEFGAPYYYEKDGKDPYCPRCWETDKKLVHVVKSLVPGWNCPQCDKHYQAVPRH